MYLQPYSEDKGACTSFGLRRLCKFGRSHEGGHNQLCTNLLVSKEQIERNIAHLLEFFVVGIEGKQLALA
jgi:hypothetical protein